ncbi:MAG TPA: response regulator, partial [Anaeromyxobacteraceae bacterium]|nr:response regulator [Anaeromyxobacteraceae bacterium]
TIETRNVVLETPNGVSLPGPAPGEYVLLSVKDTGSGMTKDVQEQVFEPFFTTKAPGAGTGLGLPTVYGIVRQNDGVIHVDSEPGRGTSFEIYLPRRGAPAADQGGTGEAAAPRDVFARRPGPGAETLLLVEDDDSVRRAVRRVLERLGYRVLVAATPGDALRIAREHAGTIHLLVTDVVMPEMDGGELASRLRGERPGIALLFTSGYPAQLTSARGTLREGVTFLAKPFAADQLAEKVREALAAAGSADPAANGRRAGGA